MNVILDAPPGAGCPVIETVRGADFCILVTEPTPFGLHLRIIVEILEEMDIPHGVVINRVGISDRREVYEYCEKEGIPVLLEIPYQRRIAELLPVLRLFTMPHSISWIVYESPFP